MPSAEISFAQLCKEEGPLWSDNFTIYNTENPDFTLCFQYSVLEWIPPAWLLTVCHMYVWFYRHRQTFFPRCYTGKFNLCKLVACLCLAGLALGTCIEYSIKVANGTSGAVIALGTAMNCVAYLVVCYIMHWEYRKGINSSGPVFLYWLLRLICTAIQTQSALRGSLQSEPVHFALLIASLCIVTVQFVAHCFADNSCVRTTSPENVSSNSSELQNVCPVKSASFVSRMSFFWFYPLVIYAYKSKITLSHCWSLMRPLTSRYLFTRLSDAWNGQVSQANKKNSARIGEADESTLNTMFESSTTLAPLIVNSSSSTSEVKPSLFRAFLQVFVPWFLRSACFRLLYVAATLLQPLLLNLLINCITHDDPIKWHGYIITALLFCLAIIRSVAAGQFQQLEWLYTYRAESSLSGLLYQKALKLSATARKTFTTGEVINLVSVDVKHVGGASFWTHMVYSAPITIAIGMYQLWQQVGIISLTALGIMLVILPLNFFGASKAAAYQEQQMAFKDQRLKLVTELLSNMKVLKLYGWESSFANIIGRIRKTEVVFIRKMLKVLAFLYCGFDLSPFLIVICTVFTYVLISPENVLNPAKVFVSIQLISIINESITCFPYMLAILSQAGVSLIRLHKFMLADEITTDCIQRTNTQVEAIRFDCANFSWERNNSEAILRNLNLTMAKSSLIAVVGRVGDGKSNLLNAVLGEMYKINGSVTINGKIAYVPQQAWIINATIRDNIVFGQEFSSHRYEQILDACALRADLAVLPHGDQTEIGDRGINLSGGQKQRISLARAAYQGNTDIYLLDDPLSAVDAHVGRHLFDQVIGPSGLLSGSCRVMTTNALFALPSADFVVVMKKGEIEEMGTYADLMQKHGSFAKLIEEYLQESQRKKTQTQQNIEKNAQLTNDSSLSMVSTSTSAASSASVRGESEELELTNRLINDEEMEEGEVKAGVYLTYVKAMTLPMVVLTIIGAVCCASTTVLLNWWLSIWSDDAYKLNLTDFRQVTNYRMTVYGGIGAAQILSVILRMFSMAVGMSRASKLIHDKLLARIIRAPMAFFDVTPIGRLTNRFSHDMDSVDTSIPDSLPFMTFEVVILASIILVVIVSAPILAVVVVPILVAYYFAYSLYIRTLRQLKRLNAILLSPILTHFHCTLLGVTSVRAHDLQDRFYRELETRMDNFLKPLFPLLCGHQWIFMMLEVLNNALVLITCMFALTAGDLISPGLASLLVTYPLQLTDCAQHVLRMVGDVETDMVNVERIEQYSNVENEAPYEVPEVDHNLPSDWPAQGTVEFRDYSVRYRPGLDLVLRNINLQVQAGERVGIVGRTGAGKSSLSLALFRLIEPANGTIYIDGVDIRYMGLQRLRTRLTIIPQEPVLFTGPLRVNLDPLNAHSDDEVWTALENAHLKTFVSALQGTLQYECAEGGENLSVGQRQLLCLARALLRKTKILVLDEATAAVDVETDELIQRTIREKFGGCTVLTIAHRLNTIMDYDKILVLDKGEVQEFASPTELMENQNSMFYSLALDAGLVST